VAGVGDEVAFAGQRGVQPVEQVVEGAAEAGDLVTASGYR